MVNSIYNFLSFLYQEKGGYFCVLTKKQDTPAKQRFFSSTDINKATKYIVDQNHIGYNVYISLNALKEPKRIKENVVDTTRFIFLDFDYPQGFYDFQKDYPHAIIVQTSDEKYQCLVVLDAPVPKFTAEQISRGLSYKYNADKTFDCTRLIRCPFTYNYKYNPPFLSKIIKNTYKTYSVNDFKHFMANTMPSIPAIPSIPSVNINQEKLRLALQIYHRVLENTPLKTNQKEKDYSVADIKFAVYCIVKQILNVSEIFSVLKAISPNLDKRKCSSTDKYLAITVERAQLYCKQKIQEKRGF